jgi:hypothetical protein
LTGRSRTGPDVTFTTSARGGAGPERRPGISLKKAHAHPPPKICALFTFANIVKPAALTTWSLVAVKNFTVLQFL